MLLACPYLRAEVEWSDERQRHVAARHPELLLQHANLIAETIAAPDEVRRSARFGNARLFSRWYPKVRDGKHVVAVVISDAGDARRRWIITAYLARKLMGGVVEWNRS